ncbi:MAG: Arylsulfatase [candidate division BRC1 bacterium ADurb.BinA364]|nr:MAG: Arylsulfatase [candidate division BRC1 bacterium ADurb.BinA364]
MWHRCLMNRAAWRHEEDFFAPRTFKMAGEWLERNYKREDFFLWVETFDPHEPWDPPQWYVDMYDPGYTGRFFGSPTYGVHKEYGITDREAKNIHACYCGEVTMIDSAVGRLMHTLEKLDILNETNIVFTTDHGTCMSQEGDGGVIGKALFVGADGMMNSGTRKLEPPIRFFPMRTGICRIPLFLHRAGQTRTRRISRIAQPWDITPTVLDLYGIAPAPEFYGESLLPLTEGKRMKPRLCALQGSEKGSQLIRQAANADWLLTEWPGSGLEPWLVDLKNNPKQDKNAAKKHPAVVKQLHEAMVRFDPRAFGAGA